MFKIVICVLVLSLLFPVLASAQAGKTIIQKSISESGKQLDAVSLSDLSEESYTVSSVFKDRYVDVFLICNSKSNI